MINFKRAAVGYIFGCAVVLSAQWTYYSAMPRSHFFDYEAVRFVEVERGRLWMQSLLEVKQVIDMRFHDILYCKQGKEFVRYSQDDSSTQDSEVGVKTPKWPYSGRLPATGGECFVRSVITAELPFGIEKSQKIRSEVFTIPPK